MAIFDDLATVLAEAGFDLKNDQDRQVLGRVVGCGKDDDDALSNGLQKILALALAEWLQWATARRRFNSLSELDSSRVLNLFLSVRRASPTVEQLVEDLAIPQGRATSMIARMKYGQARELVKFSFVAAAADVEQRVKDANEIQKRKSITVSRDVLDRLQEVEYAIFASRKGGSLTLTTLSRW